MNLISIPCSCGQNIVSHDPITIEEYLTGEICEELFCDDCEEYQNDVAA